MKNWIEKIYISIEAGKIDKGIDILFDEIDDLLCAGEFDTCNDTLKLFDLEKLDSNLLVGLLSITYAAKDKLPYRSEMVEKIRSRLKLLAPGRVEKLMRGKNN